MCYLCGVVAGPLFVIGFLVEGATRSGYDPIRHPVSSLSLGDPGWTQVANFLTAGMLTLAFAVGLRRALSVRGRGSTWGSLLVGIWAVGLIGAGIFPTDPVSGYPPGTPDKLEHYSTSGALHDFAFSLPAFLALPAACFVFARRFAVRRQAGWMTYSIVSGSVFVVGFLLTSIGFDQADGLVAVAGLLQRLTVTVGWAWLTVLAVHLVRTTSHTPRSAST